VNKLGWSWNFSGEQVEERRLAANELGCSWQFSGEQVEDRRFSRERCGLELELQRRAGGRAAL
jgi:hypothetical protein